MSDFTDTLNAKLRRGFEAALVREARHANEDAALDRAVEEATIRRWDAGSPSLTALDVDTLATPDLVRRDDLTRDDAPAAVDLDIDEANAPEPAVDIPEILQASTSYLAGPAGTGKTFLARAWVRQAPGTVLAATTGIAAINLGEGTTINALLGYFDTNSLEESFVSGFLISRFGKLFKAGVRRILLDEVSMLDARQLTCMTRALKELAGREYVRDVLLTDEVRAQMGDEGTNPDDDQTLPIAITCIGDFAQLPPVKADFAFQSPEWGQYAAHTHTLTEIRRQADRDFILALQAARRGDAAEVVRFFGPRLSQTADPHFDGTTIYATNDAVARYNQLRLDRLSTSVETFTAERWGEQRGDWTKNIPDALPLKRGSLVMILANKRLKGLDGMPGPLVYANGDLGHLEWIDTANRRAGVQLQRTDEVVEVEYIERANQVPIDSARKKELRAAGKEGLISENGRFETIGTVRYLPLRVAYATTVHKSQGLSLDHVQVNTNEGMFKQPGLLYVALSRARTAEGLRLIGTAAGLTQRCSVHQAVKPWV